MVLLQLSDFATEPLAEGMYAPHIFTTYFTLQCTITIFGHPNDMILATPQYEDVAIEDRALVIGNQFCWQSNFL